jgi:endonuclease/exonuclease/phosphatase (EEP) superfamily protein YafD
VILHILKYSGDYSRLDSTIHWMNSRRGQFILLFFITVSIHGLFSVRSFGHDEVFFKHKKVSPEMLIAKLNSAQVLVDERDYLELNELPPTPVPEEKVLQLTIWNSQKFNNIQSLIDLQNLAQQTDFFMIQEAIYTQAVLNQFAVASAFEWVGVKSFKYFGDYTGVITGSRFGSVNYKGFRSIQKEPVIKTTKSALISYFKSDTHEQLAVVNLHALNFVTNKKYELHLLPMIKELENFKGPLIMAGDFNTHLTERNRILSRWMEKLKLKHVPVFNDDRRLKLDHIYVRGVVAQPATIRKDIQSADHYPMEIKFVIPQPESQI